MGKLLLPVMKGIDAAGKLFHTEGSPVPDAETLLHPEEG